MGGENDGCTSVIKFLEVGPEVTTLLDVYPSGRFIEDEESRHMHEGAPKHRPALQPSRELLKFDRAVCFKIEALDEFIHPLHALIVWNSIVPTHVVHQLLWSRKYVDVKFLWRKADLGPSELVVLYDISAVNRDCA